MLSQFMKRMSENGASDWMKAGVNMGSAVVPLPYPGIMRWKLSMGSDEDTPVTCMSRLRPIARSVC